MVGQRRIPSKDTIIPHPYIPAFGTCHQSVATSTWGATGAARAVVSSRRTYDAEEYAHDIGDDDYEPDYDTCPSCLEKQEREAEDQAELKELRSRVQALQKEVQDERSKRIAAERRVGAGSTSEAPVAKKQKTETAPPLPPAEAEVIDLCDEGGAGAAGAAAPSTSPEASPKQVWVLTHAELPEEGDGVPSCDVVGTYLSKEKAQEAMEVYLEENGFEEGQWGYHRGEWESYIGINPAPLCLD